MNAYFNNLRSQVERHTRENAENYSKVTPTDILEGTSQDGFFSLVGGDEIRPAFVDFQFLTERVAIQGLQEEFVRFAENTMHTPKPATPLLSSGDDTNLFQTAHIQTVRNRNQLLPQFMEAGGNIGTLFPKDFDWMTLSQEQRQYFASLYEEYSGDKGSLVAAHLKSLPVDKIGATAIYDLDTGAEVVFSIRGQQADKVGETEWSVWLGDHGQFTAVHLRTEEITRFLKQNKMDYQPNFEVPGL